MVKALLCPSCGGGLDPGARACPRCGTTVATRRCGVCFDLNLIDGRRCRHCGKHLPREDPGHRPEKLPCPGCGATMTPRKLDNTDFDECDHCGGLWLCPVTLATVRTEAAARTRVLPLDLGPTRKKETSRRRTFAYRKCPLCSKYMNRSNYARISGVIVDTCKEHGCYFDQGELSRLFEFIESGGLQEARRREEEQQRAAAGDARREAILAGARGGMEFSRGNRLAEPTGLELLRFLSELF